MFRSPAWLAAALALLPAAWALSAWAAARRRRVAEALGREAALRRSADDAPERRTARARLRLAATACLLLALAGPRLGVELVETRSDARLAVIAVDVSLSMTTPDVKPSRLERAKASLSLLIDQLRGERVGIVAFAGEPQILCPLTQDADAAKQLLGALEAGAVPTPGSAVGAALRASVAMLGRYPGGKAVILLTDGEDHKSDPLGAAKEAAAAGVRVYTIGIGTPEGEPIPAASGAYHKDSKGATVVSRLDEATLTAMARETGGEYYRATPGSDEITDVARRVRELDAAKGLVGTANLWRDRYAWPAAAAYVLLLLELLLPLLPAGKGKEAAPARGAAAPLAGSLLLLLLAAPGRAATAEGRLREGNRLYDKEKYEEALESYGAAASRRPKDARAPFNAGDALYRLGRLDDAAAAFESAAARKDAPPELRARALYNLGNARMRAEDFAGAAAAYRGSLSLAPADPAARHNLALALLRMRRPPPPRRPKPDDEGKDKSDPDDQNKDKSGGGRSDGADKAKAPPQPPKTRPQDSLTKEEAERVLRAVDEREKQSQKQLREARPAGGGKPPQGEDW